MYKIFIIFDNNAFKPVFIDKTDEDILESYKKIVSKATNKSKDKLSEWINDTWNNGNEILFHELQYDLNQEELEYYLKYWRDQFSDLLIGKSAKQTSSEGKKLIEGLKSQYGLE